MLAYPDVVVTATLDYAEPTGQETTDTTTNEWKLYPDEVAPDSGEYKVVSQKKPSLKRVQTERSYDHTIRIQAGVKNGLYS